MKLFYANSYCINLDHISYIDKQNRYVHFTGGSVPLSEKEIKDLLSVMNQLHTVWCEKEYRGNNV